MVNNSSASSTRTKVGTVSLLIVALLALTVWLIFTPPGMNGKLHAIGYSVCHQIASHSLSIGGKILPLCARCTGTFLGLLITLIFLSSKERRGALPTKAMIVLLSLFFAFFVIDGVNSAVTLLPGVSPLYLPDNRLRLFSGLLFGISLGNLVLPLWNQTLWEDWDNNPVLDSWRRLTILIFLVVATGILILLNFPILYYPIAILSTITILIILSMIYILIWCIIIKRENSLHRYKDGIRIFSVGIIIAILQIGLMDMARLMITKTW